MWIYEKRLQYPVNITKTDARIAKIIASQYGGPDGEIGASMRYLSQRFTAPNRVCMAVLTDVATEELGHLEMVSTIVHQLTANLTVEEIEKQGFADYYVDHAVGIWPQSAEGFRLTPVSSSLRGIQSRICSRAWLRNRKHGAPMTISCGWCGIFRRLRIRFDSCGREKWYTSNGSVKPSSLSRIS